MSCVTVDIHGSCVSRDIFNLDSNGAVRHGSYFARHSLFSAIAEPGVLSAEDVPLSSAFQRRMVSRDVTKTMFDEMQRSRGDALIVDFVDERYQLSRLDGTLVTVSSELVNSKLLPGNAPKLRRRTADGWTIDGVSAREMMGVYCERLARIYPPENILLHRAMNADTYFNKKGKLKKFIGPRAVAAREDNEYFDFLYREFLKNLPGARAVADERETIGYEEHRWGLSPVHYHPGYYRSIMSQIIYILCDSRGTYKAENAGLSH